ARASLVPPAAPACAAPRFPASPRSPPHGPPCSRSLRSDAPPLGAIRPPRHAAPLSPEDRPNKLCPCSTSKQGESQTRPFGNPVDSALGHDAVTSTDCSYRLTGRDGSFGRRPYV